MMITGVITLWSGWGRVIDLAPIGHPCGIRELEGIHFDNLGRIVYADPQCPLEVYDNAYIVFLIVSLIGISLTVGGYRIYSNN